LKIFLEVEKPFVGPPQLLEFLLFFLNFFSLFVVFRILGSGELSPGICREKKLRSNLANEDRFAPVSREHPG